MSKFTDSVRNAWRIEELRERLLFTGGMLLIVRLGAFISVPGVDVQAVAAAGSASSNTLFGMFDMFVGGAYSKAAIFALGIMPYISASIIFQLLGAVVPYFQKLQNEGEEGTRKITTWTRYLTVILSFAQGIFIAISLESPGNPATGGHSIIVPGVAGPVFTFTAAVLFTAGTTFLMWIGEQITEKGVGNGVSLIIMIGIIARLPVSIIQESEQVISGGRNVIVELLYVIVLVAVIALVVLFTQAVRKIPVQYARRQVGGRNYGGGTQHIPIQLTTANVMPIIFAQAIMFVPTTIVQMAPQSGIGDMINRYFQYNSAPYAIVLALMIIFFTFFYTAIVFDPRQVAENMRKNGGFIPGVRPGRPTEEYIDAILTRVTVPGSVFLALVAIMPVFVANLGVTSSFSRFFGGTSLLIIVGVTIDTLKQIESYLLMRNYDGFMKSGKLRGRGGTGVPVG